MGEGSSWTIFRDPKNILFIHDKACPYTTQVTEHLLEISGWIVFDHPPYSPDLILTPSGTSGGA